MNDYRLVPVELLKDWHERINTIAAETAFNVVDEMESMLVAAPAVQGEPVEFDYPDFHEQGMGCGLEDRNITDRYEAMRYGWDEALDRVSEVIDSLGLLYTAPQSAEEIGEVVVTKDKLGNIVSVTRQDAEGRVLSVIAESEGISLSGVLAEGYFHPLPDENDYEFHDAEQFPDGSNCPACVPAVIVRKSAVTKQPAPDVAGLVEALEKIAAFQPKDILCGSGWKEWNRAGEYAASIARDALAATPQPAEQQPAPDVAGLESALKSMVSGYMRLLQSGYDRITDLGGDCDPVDVMERDDAYLREARAALAAHRKQGGEA